MTARWWVAVLVLWAAPAVAEDLLDIYRQAQAHDPTWAAAQASYRAATERLPQARALRRPTLDANAGVSENRQRVVTPSSNSRFDYRGTGYSLELVQPLYHRDTAAANEQAEQAVAQAEHELVAARDDLILRTTRAYLAVLAARDAHEHAQSEKAAVQRLLALARRNFNVGAATLIDVHEAQAAFDLATSQEIAAANELQVRREALTLLTGAPPGNLALLTGRLDLSKPETTMDSRVTAALEGNAQLKARERFVEQAAREIDRQRAGGYPRLDAVLARDYSDATNIFGTPTENTVDYLSLQLNVPLYRGGAVDSRVREAAARHDEARSQLESTRRAIAQQAREAYLAVLNGIAQTRALEQARASNQRALESTVLGQERGLRTGLDVLNNQRVLFRTLRDLSNARYNYLLSRLQLEAVTGALDEQDLESINRLLSYSEN